MALAEIAAASRIAESVVNSGSSVWDFFFRKKQWEEQKQREDTAVQRRVRDLEAAGLSPTLAAGSAAQTSQPIVVTAPRMSLSPGIEEYQAYKMREAQRTLAEREAANRGQELDYLRARNILSNQEIQKSAIDISAAATGLQAAELALEERRYNFEMAKRLGIRSDITGGLQGQIQQGLGAVIDIINRLRKDGSPAANGALDNIRGGK